MNLNIKRWSSVIALSRVYLLTSRYIPVLIFAFLVVAGADESDLNLNPSVNASRTCKTEDGRDGVCLHYTLCSSNYTILLYGEIDDNEIRDANACAGRYDWCCVDESAGPSKSNITTNITNTTHLLGGCGVAADGECPWCVALFREGGHPRTKASDGYYCAGAALDPITVVTAASCAIALRSQRVWASIGRRRSDANITMSLVTKMQTHPLYNSGTRSYDLALLELERELPLKGIPCLSISGAPGNTRKCTALAAGWGPDSRGHYPDDIAKVKMELSDVSCSGRSEMGSICAYASPPDSDSCVASAGAPLNCPIESGSRGMVRYMLRGVLGGGGGCGGVGERGGARAGELWSSADWLREKLAKANISIERLEAQS